MPRNSARVRSISSIGVRSWTVTTTDSIGPSPPSSAGERIGVTLTSAVRLRPSGPRKTTSSARIGASTLSASARGNWLSAISRPSAWRTVRAAISCSAVHSAPDGGACSVMPSTSASRRASRLNEAGAPLARLSTTTATGVMLISVSRSLRARCSSRWRRALATTSATCEANISSVSSSVGLNGSADSLWATNSAPISTP